ncbi:MAG: NAD-dependent epimerase/dehydratase family protein [Arenimonas sp.]
MFRLPALHAEPQVLVLGGAGFIGRHVLAALGQRRCRIVVSSRHPLRIDARIPVGAVRCPRRTARFEALLTARDWDTLLDGIDIVVNCVGILRQRGAETYERVHHQAPAALAQACAARAVRLVHVSALALHDDAGSRFLRSKLAGERAIQGSAADWRIVRPSLLDGPDGYASRWLRWLAKLPVHAFPADATGRIAALHVDDLGEAIATVALAPALRPDESREFEFGGDAAVPLAGMLASLRGSGRRDAWQVRLPPLLARALAHACDALHFSPFSYGHWELLRRDNLPATNRLREVLGRAPRRIGEPSTPLPAAGFAPETNRASPLPH